MKKLAILVLILCFVLGGLTAYLTLRPSPADPTAAEAEASEPVAPVEPRHPWIPTVTEDAGTPSEDDVSVHTRRYDFENGDAVEMYRLTGGESALWQKTVPEDAVVHYYSVRSGLWCHEPLNDQRYDYDIVAVEAESESLLFYRPKAYEQLEGSVIRNLPEQRGGLRAEKAAHGWTLTLTGSAVGADFCDSLVLSWSERLNWELSNIAVAWQKYLTDGKWCFDGYYYTTPSTYEPSGENCYYRCPASYIANVTVSRCIECPEARPLAVALLDTIARMQNAQGFWATDVRSNWLYTDYGIDRGFYDTRFNTDLMEIYVLVNQKLGDGLFTDTIRRYLSFYEAMAWRTHRETENGGWMIPDYWHSEPHEMPHTSLNHQAAECLTLYHIADLLEDTDARELADKLLHGIEDTADGFINWDHNLHYAYLANGTYGLRDYPYLTYNDLLALQKYLGTPNKKLQKMMDEKRTWMDNNNVKDYNH